MKRIGLLILLIGILFSSLIAESTKIAYVDTDRVMAETESTKEAQQIFQNEQKEWEQKISEMQEEIDKLTADYESKKLVLTEEGKEEAQQKIKEKQQELQDYYQEIYGQEGKAVQRNSKLLEPILEKLKNVIEKVAVENNYTIVLDAAAGALLYAKPGIDVTEEVIDEMNKTLEEEQSEE